MFNIVHLIYQTKRHEAEFKDYAFGLGTQHEHWADGFADMQQTLEHPDFFVPSRAPSGWMQASAVHACNAREAEIAAPTKRLAAIGKACVEGSVWRRGEAVE